MHPALTHEHAPTLIDAEECAFAIQVECDLREVPPMERAQVISAADRILEIMRGLPQKRASLAAMVAVMEFTTGWRPRR